YKVSKDTDFQELLFSVHTYFALLMKLIAAELLYLKETDFSSSFASQLAHASRQELFERLKDIEDGGIYARRGISNFLEGDFFRWYLDAWSSRELEEAIKEITEALSNFDSATTDVDPESSRDLLKKLYQYLVPQQVRHKLGEYYTPDWLAELLLNEVGYDGNTLKRFLDPACGSGTFLVLAIQRAKQFAKKNNEPPLEAAKRIVSNVWGFDLNPLAVIASRTNYIFALGDLLHQLPNVEIKVYLADSVLWPQSGVGRLNFVGGENLKIQTSVGDFHVPNIWVKDQGFLMTEASKLTEKMIKDNFETSIALKHYRDKGLVFTPHEKVVENFYNEIMSLEKEGKNGIWARFLKNAFAPMLAGKFDFVVGNPPWIRWGYLSQEYRKATEPLWHHYGLFSLKGHAARLGGGEKDFSMLFTYAAADYYLKKKAKLGFLITQEVFKSKGGGEGFRRFRLREQGDHLKVLKAHDLVNVKPFEGAANKTSAVILKRDFKTTYPVPYTSWERKKGIGKISTDLSLDDALAKLQKKKLLAQPIRKTVGSWMTVSEKQKTLSRLEGTNSYEARRGASTEPYGVFWLKIEQVLSDGNLIISNMNKRGKKSIKKVSEAIEQDLVYPALSGADIDHWRAKPGCYILVSQDTKTRKPYPEQYMKSNYPRSYGYLLKFKDDLLSRGSRTLKELMKDTSFYAMYGIGP
ncbi:MAG: Eco57I restriction-modification methylase domain-containing protein, partial [Thermodesulfobacteriota bacterium]